MENFGIEEQEESGALEALFKMLHDDLQIKIKWDSSIN